MIMWEVNVKTQKPYVVYIGKNLIEKAGEILSNKHTPGKIVIVTDDNVAKLYAEKAKVSFEKEGFDVDTYIFPAGEASKNNEELFNLVAFFAEKEITKADIIVALGGGVVGDIAGFAASIYLRGVPYIQMPTTVLAAVDSSVGGKTAINLPNGKNMAGSFYQPKAVICDATTFETLEEKVYAAGLAECIKYGMIKNEPLFTMLQQPIDAVKEQIEKIVADCIAMKAKIVEKDEFDENERRLLNFGHTIGHAIEVCSSYTIVHGQAVAIGMIMAARIAEKLKFTCKPCSETLSKTLAEYGLPTKTSFSAKELAKAAMADKKRNGSEIALILPKKIGKCEIYTARVEELEKLFEMGV